MSMLAVTLIFCCFYLIGTDAAAHTHRNVRQAVPEYYLDVLVITDYSVWKWWYDRTDQNQNAQSRRQEALRNIRQYYTLLIKDVSDQYGRLQMSFRLKFQPVGFYIVENTDQSTWWTQKAAGAKRVDVRQAFDKLQTWLIAQRSSLPPYDHALLFTREDIATGDDGATTGYGSVGTICREPLIPRYRSRSIVEDKGAFQPFTTMHELGHSLNISHDGENNECNGADRYVMSGGQFSVNDDNRGNQWFFSTCSVQAMENYVRHIVKTEVNVTCLRTSLPQVDVPDVTALVPGQVLDADNQCMRLHGPRSLHSFAGNLTATCLSLRCVDPSYTGEGFQYFEHLAATGTTCGNRQWCQVGQCVASSQAPSIGSCYKNRYAQTVNGKSCEQMVKVEPYLCYRHNIYPLCCQSCDNSTREQAGCPYGDRFGDCTAAKCNRITSDGKILDYSCCHTCRFDMSTWTCSDVALLDGKPCSQAVQAGGVQQCYNWTVAYHCCATCEKLRDLTRGEGCEYGDRFLRGCPVPARNATTVNCNARERDECCYSCQVKTTDSASCPTSPHLLLLFFAFLLHSLALGSTS